MATCVCRCILISPPSPPLQQSFSEPWAPSLRMPGMVLVVRLMVVILVLVLVLRIEGSIS
jgi:hypothetical protein